MNLNLYNKYGGHRHALHKFLLVMKLIIILITTAILQVSASTYAQKITLNRTNVPLEKVMKEIRQQSGYDFFYDLKLIKNTKPISINVKDASLEEVLDKCFANQPLTYKIGDKVVMIREKDKPVIDKVKGFLNISLTVSGKVTDTVGAPLPGATIAIKGKNLATVTNDKGEFSINADSGDQLVISFIGFDSQILTVSENLSFQSIVLHAASSKLNEVVVNTGYQQVSPERTTGAFSTVDNKLIDRVVSTDILRRIQDVVPGLIFNHDLTATKNSISIRGESTIYGNAAPLIVLDNFPYDGDINSINPNDIENITVLKDAASASIWGARAGNGVIVITTKKGKFNTPTKVSFNSNVTIGNKPDLFYQPKMTSSDFIDVEKKLFASGYYKSRESSLSKSPLSPVVELLIAARDNVISQTDANSQIDVLRSKDVRNDLEKYFYQKSINQQYSLNLSGGTANQNYYISTGLDRNKDNEVRDSYTRFTLNASNTYSLLKQKLQLTTGLYYAYSQTAQNNPGSLTWNNGQALYPYAQLADAQGNPLAVVKDYRTTFINAQAQQKLLDWNYRPLEELQLSDNRLQNYEYRILTNLSYKILPWISAGVVYQYERSENESNNLQSQQTYYTRSLINRFTQVNADGSLKRIVPLGSILDTYNSTLSSQNIRGQLNINKNWNDLHQLDIIAGTELRDAHTTAGNNRLYGYDQEHVLTSSVDYVNTYPLYYNPASKQTIPNYVYRTDLTDRFFSYYSNATYSYKKRYILTASGRLDQSNLFGVKTNQKGVPLYSIGAAWDIAKESFYTFSWLPELKIRTSFGYNGNIDKSLSAYTTASYYNSSLSVIRQPYADIINPPNPELRWERVRIINAGIDFGTKNRTVTGSFDIYQKNGYDLIGDSPFAPSTGITAFRGNIAGTKGHGIDISLNTKNIDHVFKWQSNFLFSYVHEQVSDYATQYTGLQYIQTQGIPLIGKPLYAIYSYKWAGLDPQTGNPQGYADGKVSQDYGAIANGTTSSTMVYHGSARPITFGAFRNTFQYKSLSLSVNINYRLGYYFRKPSVDYTTVLTGQGGNGDYGLRWQKSGDELHTNVPSMPSQINYYRELFYTYSSTLVEKGDHIRLQDIQAGYQLKKIFIYCNADNVAMIWKATKSGYDPDYVVSSYVPPRTISFGLRTTF